MVHYNMRYKKIYVVTTLSILILILTFNAYKNKGLQQQLYEPLEDDEYSQNYLKKYSVTLQNPNVKGHANFEDASVPVNDVCLKVLKDNYNVRNGVFLDKNEGDKNIQSDWNFTLTPQNMCYDTSLNGGDKLAKDIFIISMIHTSPNHFERRASIRETWGSITNYFNYNLRIMFMLGEPGNETLQALINQESKLHNDIVQANFLDAYHNLTYKMAMGYKWISYNCPQAEFILKLDDDIYVNIFKIIYALHSFKDRYGELLNNHIDSIRPRSKLLPYTYNQSDALKFEDFEYLIPGRDIDNWLHRRLNSSAIIKNMSYPAGLTHKFPMIQMHHRDKKLEGTVKDVSESVTLNECRKKCFNMEDIDPEIKAEYHRLFPSKLKGNQQRLRGGNQFRDVIFGMVMVNSGARRENDSKWYVTKDEYAGQYYEPHCSGWSLILTPPLAYKLYKAYLTQPYIYIDDIHFTGKLARIAGALLINIDHTINKVAENLDNWILHNETSFGTNNAWNDFSQFKYVFCDNGGNRTKMRQYWNKTIQAHNLNYQSFFDK